MDKATIVEKTVYPVRRGVTGPCKSIRHWAFCLVMSNGRRITDQGYATKKEAEATIARHYA